MANTPTKDEVTQELLAYLDEEKKKSEAWVFRNDAEGFPDAAESHRVVLAKWQRFIALVETIEPDM